jgi:subtilisin family serine protease
MPERGVKAPGDRRTPVRKVLAVAALALAASTVLAAGAATRADSANARVTVKRSHTITLVTGDRVVLNVLSNGKQTATVPDQSGPGGYKNEFRSFHAVDENGEIYVYPVEVGPYLGKQLDRELFNLTALVEQGYADKASATLPVIVSLRPGAARKTLPGGITAIRSLQSIDAVAGRELKSRARMFGRALKTQLKADAPALKQRSGERFWRSGPFAGVESIHLDEKVKASLADSVPQIGAPAAWAAGFDGTGVDVAVLDTGIDKTHPDLAGKVVAELNFTDAPSVTDVFGHGTHVAGTVAGTGVGSGGARKGVAPGAELLNGKVLNDFGSGLESWIIDGMEWAADNGAEVISMSLQGGFSDGTDPMAQAVNDITATRGVLFTIAAGNVGFFGEQSVTTPGTASSALTVGAVSKSDVLADFSGRGPRLGDFAVKPDVTAPGVDIIAPRAAGSTIGPIVDEIYMMLSGTSMATPHAAGAAAILKQEFPLWTPQELKSALVSTALPGPYSVYQQGGGRIDVARAFSQKVYATPAPVDFGFFPFPHTDPQQVTKTITYTNGTAADVTLNLTVDVRGRDGTPSAPGQVTASASSVTVPAGGTATVDVTVDEGVGTPNLYGGFINAQSGDGSVVVRTPVGFYLEPEMYNLTVDGIARDGRPARGISWVEVINAVDTTKFTGTAGLGNGPVTLRVPPGTYSAMGFIFTYDEPHVFATEVTMAGDPQFEVTGDTTVIADARPASEVVADTGRKTEPQQIVLGNFRSGEEQGSFASLLLTSFPIDRVFAAPTEQVTVGYYEFYSKWSLRAPQLELSVTRPETIELDHAYAFGSPLVDGNHQLPVVYVGLGRAEDYEGRDVRGKIVLIQRGQITFAEKIRNANAHDAGMVIIFNNVPGLLLVGLVEPSAAPVITLSKSQGELIRGLLENGPVRMRARGTPVSPFMYDLLFPEEGGIDGPWQHTIGPSNTVRINAKYLGHVAGWLGGEAHHAFRPAINFSFEGVRNYNAPLTRTEFVSVIPDNTRWQHLAWLSMTTDFNFQYIFDVQLTEPLFTYQQRGNKNTNWYKQPLRPGVIKTFGVGGEEGLPAIRTGDTIQAQLTEFNDDELRWGFFDSQTDQGQFRLFQNNELIAQGTQFCCSFPVSGDPSTFRAELSISRNAPYWRYSSDTDTSWTFRSSRPAPGVEERLPLLFVDYDLGELDLLNRAERGQHTIRFGVHRQQGAPTAALTNVRLFVSYNDGATWSNQSLSNLGGGNYSANLNHPANPARQNVSLRIQATDAGGSSINQTIIRAYGLE